MAAGDGEEETGQGDAGERAEGEGLGGRGRTGGFNGRRCGQRVS